jgi:hypothetical protein
MKLTLTRIVTISITIEAYNAVTTTLPHGDVALPPQIDGRGGVRFIVDRHTLDRLTALRGRGALFALGANQARQDHMAPAVGSLGDP